MNEETLQGFLDEDCDQHARSTLLAAIKARRGTGGIQDFTFNRFNVRLDFANDRAVIDDELNPGYGDFTLSLDDFVGRVAAVLRN